MLLQTWQSIVIVIFITAAEVIIN